MTTLRFVVTEDDTAVALGSGSLAVLGTPRLLAWCEAATCAAIADRLAPGQTSVGTAVALEHRAASAVGALVSVEASVLDPTGSPGRTVELEVTARDEEGGVLGAGRITRVVVDSERFLRRLAR